MHPTPAHVAMLCRQQDVQIAVNTPPAPPAPPQPEGCWRMTAAASRRISRRCGITQLDGTVSAGAITVRWYSTGTWQEARYPCGRDDLECPIEGPPSVWRVMSDGVRAVGPDGEPEQGTGEGQFWEEG
jgi:hypothetical protein